MYMGGRYICIHGHFYQPPRENAWLETIQLQDSAYPYHDWNDRITAESYAANAYSRIMDGENHIVDIFNNYARISFNFGPTLLSWMENRTPDLYEAILAADKESLRRYKGHGSAMAQAHSHIIMPLAKARDKYTQVYWGMRDFEYRFGRLPEGMWLPETAVDLETLDIMADLGLTFTILSPTQAASFRREDSDQWQDVGDNTINTTRAYRIQLPSGRSFVLFFFHGDISRAVAFERLLSNGEYFAHRLLEGFSETDAPQLVNIATDGETYGHHQPMGDMALAFALRTFENTESVQLTNYSAFLAAHPPRHEVSIFDNTAWSCFHGVGRWFEDCGCNSGMHAGWHQKWRKPLRDAFDWLRDNVTPLYEAEAGRLLKDPWQARNDYIEVVRARATRTIEDFFREHAQRPLDPADQITVLKLMELQRHCMFIYTSCGWFFDELSGIETVQVIQYAGRLLQLASDLFEQDLEEPFLQRLAQAPSNIPEHANGRTIYEKWVRPAMLRLREVGAHFAISSLFSDYQEHTKLYCFYTSLRAYHRTEAGRAKLAVGRVTVSSAVTWEAAEFLFGVLHMGDHNISCGLREYHDARGFRSTRRELSDAFDQGDFPDVMRKLDQHFSGNVFSMKSLFKDEKRRIMDIILQSTVNDALSVYRAVYEPNVPLLRFLKGASSPTPKALITAGELVLNHTLQQELEAPDLNFDTITDLLLQADLAMIPLDAPSLEFTFRKNIERLAAQFDQTPEYPQLDQLAAAVELVYLLPFDVNLRKVQDIHYTAGRRLWKSAMQEARQGHTGSVRWTERFARLGDKLLIRLPEEE
jgi:alpha-amylase/alpha-mannosidase (GH57 family)